MPSIPILTIIEPTIELESGTVRVSWTTPERGQVQVFRSPQPFPHSAGELVDRKNLDSLVGTWIPRTAPDHIVDRNGPSQGQVYYTPLIAWAGRLTVGRTVSFSHVPDPTDLRAVRVGRAGRVLLRWKWPPDTTACLVIFRAGQSPTGPDDPFSSSLRVDPAFYSRLDSFAVLVPSEETAPTQVLVVACRQFEGREVVSPGLDPSCRTTISTRNSDVEVSYELTAPTLLRRNWLLSLRTNPPGAAIPPLAVVSHARTVPFSVDDGQIVARLPASKDQAKFPVRLDRVTAGNRLRIFPDPTADPDHLLPVRIRHPDNEQTRV